MAFISLSTEPVVFLFHIISTINLTVMPQLLLRKFCLRESGFTDGTCVNEKYVFEDIHKKATEWWFIIQLFLQVPSVITIPLLVPISDKIGRRNSMIVITLVDILSLIIFAINAYFKHEHPAFIIPGYLLMSLYGGYKGMTFLCFTFVADITKHKLAERTLRMVLVEVSLECARALGGLFSGYLLKALDYMSVFLFSIGIHGLILFYISWYLPKYEESTTSVESEQLISQDSTQSQESEDTGEQTCCIQEHIELKNVENMTSDADDEENVGNKRRTSVCSVYKKLFVDTVKMMKEQPIIIHILLVNFFVNLGYRGESLIQTLYLKNYPFYFYSLHIGYYIGIQGGARLIGSVLVIISSFYCLHCNDYALMITGSISQILSFTLIAIARSSVFLFCATATSFAVPLCYASMRSFLTKIVSDDKHATVMGLVYSVNALSALCTNLLSSTLYRTTLSYYTGTVYFGLAAYSGIALAIILVSCIVTRCAGRF